MKRFFSFLGVALVALSLCINVIPASAADSQSTGLSIIPRKNYLIEPGKSVTDKLTIGNLSSTQDLSVTFRMVDFTFTDQSGTPKLFLAQNAPQTTWSLKPFTTLPETVRVKAGGSVSVPLKINIPKNQGAGSYYSAIQYSSGAGEGGNVNLSASGVTLVFVSIPGKVNENMKLTKFGAYQLDKTKASGSFTYINLNPVSQLAYSVKNEGNVAEGPTGSITVSNMFGKEVAMVKDINPNASLALIGQTRLFTACIKSIEEDVQLRGKTNTVTNCTDPHLSPGFYTAKLDILYGQNGNLTKEVTGTAHFWYLPAWFIIVVVVILLILAVVLWRLYRKFRETLDRAVNKRRRR